MVKSQNMEIVGAEVCAVLEKIPNEKYYKIPKKITSLFEKYKDNKINTEIDFHKSFEEQNISKQAKDIIFCISFNYWITEEEKKQTLEIMKKNEVEINEKYSVENIFKNTENKNVIEDSNLDKQENVAVTISKKENILIRFFKFIKKIIKK